MDRPISALVNVALTPDLVMAIAKDDQGWRFESWLRSEAGEPLLPPPGEDSERYFPSLDEAVSYFRERYKPITCDDAQAATQASAAADGMAASDPRR